MPAIETRGLTKRYGALVLDRSATGAGPTGIRALEDLIDRGRSEGEIFGFLGPNGAGKSTTIRLLLGLPPPDGRPGHVLGLDAVRDSVAIRRRVGYLPGGIAFWDDLTGERLLDELAALSGRPPIRRGGAARSARADAQRPSAARCATTRAGCARSSASSRRSSTTRSSPILDEPTEGLDPLMQRAFYEILDELRAAGRTIFFSSHVLSEVERVCDRVAIVRPGRLVALEEVPALLARRKRNVEMRLAGPPPALGGRAGRVSECASADGWLTCRLEGDVGPFLAAIAGAPIARPDDRAGPPRGGVPRVLRADRTRPAERRRRRRHRR